MWKVNAKARPTDRTSCPLRTLQTSTENCPHLNQRVGVLCGFPSADPWLPFHRPPWFKKQSTPVRASVAALLEDLVNQFFPEAQNAHGPAGV